MHSSANPADPPHAIRDDVGDANAVNDVNDVDDVDVNDVNDASDADKVESVEDNNAARVAGESLRIEVRGLLDGKGKGGIDESRAKQLRKRWQQFQDEHGDDASLGKLFAQLRERVHAQVDKRESQHQKAVDALAELKKCVAPDGDVARARELEKIVVNALNQMPGLSLPRRSKIVDALESLQPKLRTISARQKRSDISARKKLIDEIRALVKPNKSDGKSDNKSYGKSDGKSDNKSDNKSANKSDNKSGNKSDIKPAQIVQRIKQARDTWREWDKKGQSAGKKLFDEFNQACNEAYKPCRKHFADEKKHRRANAVAREQVCAALEKAHEQIDWRAADWKAVQKTFHNYLKQWRNCGATDAKTRKTLQARFDAVAEKFTEPMARERRRNLKMREGLIEQVVALGQSDDARAAFAKVQALQKQWKPSVTGARNVEQKLWKRFSAVCDEVYALRNKANKEFKKGLNENLTAREALCAEIEKSCGASERPDLSAQLAQWQTKWQALGEPPKAAREKVNDRYKKAVALAKQTLAADQAANATKLRATLLAQSTLCAQLESAALENAKGADALVKKTLTQWAKAKATLPPELAQAMHQRRELALRAVGVVVGEVGVDDAGKGDVVADGKSAATGKGDVVVDGKSDAAGKGDVVVDGKSVATDKGDVVVDGKSVATDKGDVVADGKSAVAGKGDVAGDDKSDTTDKGDVVDGGKGAAAGKGDVAGDDKSDTTDKSAAAGKGDVAGDDKGDTADKGGVVADDKGDATDKDDIAVADKSAASGKSKVAVAKKVARGKGGVAANIEKVTDDERAAAVAQLRDSLAGNLARVYEELLRLEILCEVDSPAEFAPQRMALQVARLSAALGKAADSDKNADELIGAIAIVGAIEPAAQGGVAKRLGRCVKALDKAGGK